MAKPITTSFARFMMSNCANVSANVEFPSVRAVPGVCCGVGLGEGVGVGVGVSVGVGSAIIGLNVAVGAGMVVGIGREVGAGGEGRSMFVRGGACGLAWPKNGTKVALP